MPYTDLVVGPKEPGNEEFGHILRTYRIQKGLTRKQAAERFGFTSEYLRLIERGKRTPAWGNMPLIFGVYDVSYILVDEEYVVDEASIKFTSRIREARSKEEPKTPGIPPDPNRAQQIAQIVELLVEADERALRAVHSVLRSQSVREENIASNEEPTE
jgi:transcriptional regulator with XRE-family HTH domain